VLKWLKLNDETEIKTMIMVCSTKFTFYIIYYKTISNKKDEGKIATESINKS
jgi:hypothetical protein